MKKIFNCNTHKRFRQALRSEMTNAEKLLWAKVRNKQLGVKFRRQHGIGNYIVDFYCPEKGLIIELDGDSHFQNVTQTYDEARDLYMQELGLRVLRFLNSDVEQNMEGVLERISTELGKR